MPPDDEDDDSDEEVADGAAIRVDDAAGKAAPDRHDIALLAAPYMGGVLMALSWDHGPQHNIGYQKLA